MVAIKILDPQIRNNPKDAFVIDCVAMVGDGDEFHKFRLPVIHKTSGYEQKLTEIVEHELLCRPPELLGMVLPGLL